ncbi:DNA topoisomerase [Handroanthus impetiginosus]|uniref:DNA topoisomerase n=1 Tax=Handroanthus impetiginosus TaxID=429701 RepID=A0A2G9HUL6_9LAMI|nr:DNA topoisomerase [Handroanthus impetiginosus]
MSSIEGSTYCHCGRRATLRTSWTKENPGRRFHSCHSYKEEGCAFFVWEDPPMCARSSVIIPGLLQKCSRYEAEIDELRRVREELQHFRAIEEEVQRLRKKKKILQAALVLTWLLVLKNWLG